MKLLVRLFTLLLPTLPLAVANAQAPVDGPAGDALAGFLQANPNARASVRYGFITRIFGNVKEGGISPAAAAQNFVNRNATLLGVAAGELEPFRSIGIENDKFIAVQLRQQHRGTPVYGGGVAVLVKPGLMHEVVLVVPSTKPVPEREPARALSAEDAIMVALQAMPDAVSVTDPEYVIWSDGRKSRYSWMLIADNGRLDQPSKNRFFIDAETGEVLETKSEIYYADITGVVQGWATPGVLPDTGTNPPALIPLAGLRVAMPPDLEAFTDETGNFTFPFTGQLLASMQARLIGRWVQAIDVEGRDEVIAKHQSPTLPFFFEFNSAQVEHITSQVNAFIHTEIVHNFAKAINPAFPGIDIRMPANVNIDSSCNAFYDGVSINFFRASGGCVNTAYSSVVYHEYGHHIVASGHLSPTGDFHEGAADITSMLLLDDPIIARDFAGPGNHVRDCSTSNEQYPCNGGPHQCGQVICGAFWDTLVGLKVKWGNDPALDIARFLYLNLILMSPRAIDPDITIDVLTLDDDDGDIMNGTPNYAEINTGFTAHNLPAPPVPPITQFNMTPPEVVGGFTATITIGLNSVAGGGGVVVTLASSNPAALPLPPSVTIPSGSSTTSFTVTSNPVSTRTVVTLSATTSGFTREFTAVVHPLTFRSLSMNPSNVVGGTSSVGTVTFDPPVPDGGVTINLASSHPSVASVPATLNVAGGATSATFPVTTFPTGVTAEVRITASFGPSSVHGTITVQTPSLFSFVVSPRTIQGGNTTTGTVFLNGPAPAGGAVVTLQSLKPAVVQVPASVTVAAGATSASFTITSSPVQSQQSVTVRASRFNIRSQLITVNP
ncbi:MAG: hypothetical protein AB1725_05030 [Armatimonadota bacterium]